MRPRAPVPGRPDRERPLVLFVDDNQTQLDLYTMMVEDEMDVVPATRAELAYALASRHQPDAIVLDVVLPDGDGLDMHARFRAAPSTAATPIIVLTGDENAYSRALLLRSSLTQVFAKPCSAERLLAALRAAVAPPR